MSVEKSQIYFSQNVATELKEIICEKLGIHATNNLGKYLGFPLKHKGAPRSQYNFIAGRVISKLACRKSKFLSFASRTVLVKSVMLAMPNYVMQGMTLPTHLCEKLDKINRDFLWGYSSQEKKRMHMVGWSKIIRLKEQGRLGIQAAKAKNLALLAKINWRMYQEKDALRAKVILGKYYSQSRRLSKDVEKLPCSTNWKDIKMGFLIFSKGICWNVGNGTTLKFLDR